MPAACVASTRNLPDASGERGGAQREAVHRHPVKRGQVAVRPQVRPQDPAVGLGDAQSSR